MPCTACTNREPGARILTYRQSDRWYCSNCNDEILADQPPEMMDAMKEANSLVNGVRQDDYGKPEDSFAIISAYWTTYIYQRFHVKLDLRPRDICALMNLMKIARGTKSRDTWIDQIGYAAIAADRLSD